MTPELGPPPRVVLTGGPGGGKTAVLEVVRRQLGGHVEVLPESAGILFAGGFPRRSSRPAVCAAERAIFHVQRELERLADEESTADLVVSDRGTLDGLAYWPEPGTALLDEMRTTRDRELARYAAVVHLRPPADMVNRLRPETIDEALAIDERIERAWEGHPRRFIVASTPSFMDKIARALELVRGEIRTCRAGMPPKSPSAS